VKAKLSAKDLKFALKSLKNILETFYDTKNEAVYYFKAEKNKLYLFGHNQVVVSIVIPSELSDTVDKPFGFDFDLFSSLKYPIDEVLLTFADHSFKVSAGALHVELVAQISEKTVKHKAVELKHTFPKCDFERILSFHNYGYHHNPVEAGKRPVSISSKDNYLLFQSFDKQVSAFNKLDSAEHLEEAICVLPKPMGIVLAACQEPTFKFGLSKQHWRIQTGNLDVSFPNMVKQTNADFTQILKDIRSKPCLLMEAEAKSLYKSLDVLSPSAKGKDENPKMSICVGEKLYAELESAKIRSMRIELDQCKIQEKGLALTKERIPVNYRYISEFVSNLSADNEIFFQWWKHRDNDAPLKGRALSLYNKTGRYIIARLL